jgi:hypothetical protein
MVRKLVWSVVIVVTVFLTSCSNTGGSNDPAAKAVVNYLQAVVSGDASKVSSNSCKDWESQAMMEMDSFAGVKANVDQAVCKTTSTDGSMTQVTCTGKIKATYNNENQEFDLSGRTYQVTQQGGEWLVCGYK